MNIFVIFCYICVIFNHSYSVYILILVLATYFWQFNFSYNLLALGL